METRTVVFVCFAFFLVTGCATSPSRPDAPLRQATAEQLIELLRERAAAVQSMKGLFRAQVQGPGIPIAQRVEGAMFYQRSDALRLQGFNRLGGELFQFVLGADFYTLRLPAGRVFSGPPAELERMGEIARPFKLSVLAMSGVVGIAGVGKDERTALAEDGDRYRLDVFAPASGEIERAAPYRRIWFDRRSLQVVQEDRLSAAGKVEVMVQFDDYRPLQVSSETFATPPPSSRSTEALMRPFRITAQEGQGRGVISLTFHEMVPNIPLKPDDLRLTDWRTRDDGRGSHTDHETLGG